MTFKTLAISAAVAVTTLLALPAHAQFAKSEEAVKHRQGSLFVIGQHFGRIGAMVNGKLPFDAKAAQENADIVAAMAAAPTGFGPNRQGRAAQGQTQRVTEKAKFNEHAQTFQAEAAKAGQCGEDRQPGADQNRLWPGSAVLQVLPRRLSHR